MNNQDHNSKITKVEFETIEKPKSERTKFDKGRIVVVKNGLAYGNPPGTITKIIATKGEHIDTFDIFNTLNPPLDNKYRLCESVRPTYMKYLNKTVVIELVDDLQIANKQEKKQYYKSRKTMYNG